MNKEVDTNLYDKKKNPTMISGKDEKFWSKRRKEQKTYSCFAHSNINSKVSTVKFLLADAATTFLQ